MQRGKFFVVFCTCFVGKCMCILSYTRIDEAYSFEFCIISVGTGAFSNFPPTFNSDINSFLIPEDTPVGKVIGILNGTDPEGSPVHYGVTGTDFVSVDRNTGEVTVVKPFDREVRFFSLTFFFAIKCCHRFFYTSMIYVY